jgi:hypothetical protein
MSTHQVEQDDIHGEDGVGHKLIKCLTLEKEERSKLEGKGIHGRALLLLANMQ